ncbi:SGT1 protein-domain-containing protein [Absidia repens]|uniref:SGT1 protein-domain-containing protein n=1 Tax=Absidia repens TaxID=90262 RepID=A0A1X2IQ60_9FUNG|nr:SGT1 protein-domain-containing protein [Absidia repens]
METLRDVFNGTASTEINYIQYSIYFPPRDTKTDNLQALYDAISNIDGLIAPLVDGHLWQKDAFKLRPVYNDLKDPKYPFLFGLSRFGDCLNDEWFIIHLLYHISIHCKDAIIAVSDNDGEVLLIEAALDLPDWLDPSNSDNRVYIFQGQLHIIPLPTSPADIFTFMANGGGSAASKHALKTQDALDLLWKPGDMVKTVASDAIQRTLNDRLKKSQDHAIHRTRTILANAQAAYVLLSAPQLLPLAVDAFYLRDPESLKTCAAMRQFPPNNNNNSMDMILPWTRTTFAQTLHQQFYAPKPFRHLPSKQDESFQAADLGMKLMCGLEMLYAKKEEEAESVEQEQRKLGNDQVDTYDLLEMAPTSLNGRTSKQTIDALLKQYTPARLEDLVKKRKQCKEDAVDWMDVYPDELDALLSQKTDHDNTATQHNANGELMEENNNNGGDGDDLPPVNLEDMMAKFEQFLEHSSSGVEGVNLPGDEESDEDDDDDDEADDVAGRQNGYGDAEEDVNQQISFDFTSFMDILNQGIPGSSPAPRSKNTDDKLDLEAFMNEMDREIAGHEKIGGSFVRDSTNSGIARTTTNDEEGDVEDEEDEAAPVDVQLNLIQNVLESFKGQQGLPGPAGNLLRQFNIALPADKDDVDDE